MSKHQGKKLKSSTPSARDYKTEWNVYRDEKDELKLSTALAAKRISFPIRGDRVEEYDPFQRMEADRKKARRLRRRRLVRVTSGLGLISVRIALTDIGNFDRKALQMSSVLSELVYHSPDVLRDMALMRGIKRRIESGFPVVIAGNEPTDAQASIWLFPDASELYISFRGDHDLDDLYFALGLSERSVADLTDTVHPSFLATFMEMEPLIRPQVESTLNRIDRIIVTGHGLGAALATLAAPFFAEVFPDEKVDCFTFGGPKVGGRDFSDWFNTRVDRAVRVIASSDPVPYFPLGREDYHHVTDATCITKAGYCESWSINVKPSAALLDGIDRIEFDEFRWQQTSTRYRKRVGAALSRSDHHHTSKSYITVPSKLRGA